VDDVSVALQHNLGLGGAVVVTVYKRADLKNSFVSDSEVMKKSQFEYNPAVEARGVSAADADIVRSKSTRNQWALGDTEQKVMSARL
jgi:sterol carrier protein 2